MCGIEDESGFGLSTEITLVINIRRSDGINNFTKFSLKYLRVCRANKRYRIRYLFIARFLRITFLFDQSVANHPIR